jgi:hypothetical protein
MHASPRRSVSIDDTNKRKGLEPKDYITIVLSSLALLVSSLTAYFSVVVQTDDLRLILRRGPVVFVDEDVNQLVVDGKVDAYFSNGGNRSAAIIWFDMVI